MKSPRFIVALGLAVTLALGLPAGAGAAAALPKGMAAGPSIEGISEYTLANGLRVLLFPDATKPTVTVNLVYGVGSVHENYGETGMAHLLEHLLFKGTPTQADISAASTSMPPPAWTAPTTSPPSPPTPTRWSGC